jgi:hypothetical protein
MLAAAWAWVEMLLLPVVAMVLILGQAASSLSHRHHLIPETLATFRLKQDQELREKRAILLPKLANRGQGGRSLRMQETRLVTKTLAAS